MPGDTGGRILKQLEESSRSKCGKDFGLCYNPEFIALGNIIHDILNPDMILIGENDSQAGDLLESIYQQIVDNQPRYTRTNWVNAELVKLSVNTFVTTKISYANMLSELCDQLPGADIDQVTDAIGLDSRIGRKYLKGGLGYGGPCFPRDNDAFTQLALNLGVSADIALATQRVNARQSNRLAQLVMQEYQGGKVGILGLSYKPFTNFVEKSQGIELAQILQSQGVPVVAWDPESMQNARQVLGDQIDWATSLQDCVEQSNVLVVATQWPQFSDIDQNMLIHFPTIIDCWRMLDWRKLNGHARILTLGKGK
jgi:UDPglucose 6-dehydrogenase